MSGCSRASVNHNNYRITGRASGATERRPRCVPTARAAPYPRGSRTASPIRTACAPRVAPRAVMCPQAQAAGELRRRLLLQKKKWPSWAARVARFAAAAAIGVRWKLSQALAGRHGRCVCLGERACREDRVAHAHACEKGLGALARSRFRRAPRESGIVRHTRGGASYGFAH